MTKWKTFIIVGAALLLGGPVARSSHAAAITFTGSSGSLAASARFETSGTNLIVTLTNTSTADVNAPGDVLTGVFFDVSGTALTVTRTSAVLGAGSVVLFGTTDPGNVVGGEWAYKNALSGAPVGAKYGISSSGLNLFGPGDRFPGNNLQGPDSPDGVQYGIVSAGDNPATGNTPVTGSNALIKNQVVFTLSGLPSGFNPAERITNLFWQYGTALDEAGFPSPEPATLVLFVIGACLTGRRTAWSRS